MAVRKAGSEPEGGEPSQTQPEPKTENPVAEQNDKTQSELEAAKARIADLEAKLKAEKSEHDKTKADLESAEALLAPAQPSAPAEDPIPKPSETDIAEFDRKAKNAFERGFVYCVALKTVLARGEACYRGKYFFMPKEDAKRLESLGDLKIVRGG